MGVFLRTEQTLWWEDGALWLIDQRSLPDAYVPLRCATPAEVAEAIRDMAVQIGRAHV